MKVAVLLLTHTGLGTALVNASRGALGNLPLPVEAADYRNGEDIEAAVIRAARALRAVDQGAGVLVLTDLFGATPSNIAARLARETSRLRRVSGVNLPMLLRIMNYPEQDLDTLAATASGGGRNGVIVDQG